MKVDESNRAPAAWEKFLLSVWPKTFTDARGIFLGWAEFQREFWEWVWKIELGLKCDPFISIWPRDSGKSTNAEVATVVLGAKRARKYVLYVSGTQDQADDHVASIESLMDNQVLEALDPELCQRRLTKYGHARGWRRNRLATASGFVVDALGLSGAARGVKFDDQRPDLIIFDDIDDETDSVDTVEKKITMLTRKVIPAGSSQEVVVMGVQNLVHPNSIFTRMVDGRADFLVNRYLSGPHPAIVGLQWAVEDRKPRILGGVPTWEGLNLERCQAIVNDIGMRAFLIEHQHDVGLLGGVYFDHWDEDTMTVAPSHIPAETWWKRWISIDWGFAHDSAVYWHTHGSIGDSPKTYTYREFVQNKLGPLELAEEIANFSQGERIDAIYLSPDAFAKRTDAMTIAQQLANGLKMGGLPVPQQADNDRIGGWMLMYQLLKDGEWLIADTCYQLIDVLPKLMRDEKRVEDIAKVDGDDPADAVRYGLKTRLSPRRVPLEERIKEQVTVTDPTQVAIQSQRLLALEMEKRRPRRFRRRGPRGREDYVN